MAKSHNQNDSIESLLTELLGSGSPAAWKAFLSRYGPLVMSIARQHALDPHDAQDGFIYVCEKLCEDDCRRLRIYDPKRGGKFETWLAAIVANLCADWCRSRYGRPGIPPAIQALPAAEQLVFELSVLKGLDRESCLIGLRRRFPETTRAELSDAMAVVHTALSPRQRWKYTVFRQRGQVAPGAWRSHGVEAGDGDDPLDQTAENEARARLQEVLSRLNPQQRLLLRLRYEQEMTLEEIARLAGLNDLHQARRIIQAALREIGKALPRSDFL